MMGYLQFNKCYKIGWMIGSMSKCTCNVDK